MCVGIRCHGADVFLSWVSHTHTYTHTPIVRVTEEGVLDVFAGANLIIGWLLQSGGMFEGWKSLDIFI